ncbi:MAG: SH3 domain-containing protein [Lachnospiraceae bacterium]|nr:SH3 domain-containing protein [Lachnospiraceae bacterium]
MFKNHSVFYSFIAAAAVTAAFGVVGLPVHAASLSSTLPSAGISYVLSSHPVNLEDVERSLMKEGKFKAATKKTVAVAVGAAVLTEDAEKQSTAAAGAIITTALTDKQKEIKDSGIEASYIASSEQGNTAAAADTTDSASASAATSDAAVQTSESSSAAYTAASEGAASDSTSSSDSDSADTGIAVSSADDFVNIRSEASTDAKILGKLYKDSVATIIENTGTGWVKIKSGDVTGYVKDDYLKTGTEAKQIAEENASAVAKVTTETLRVRAAASLDADVISLVPQGETLNIISQKDGWIEVDTADGFGYISSDFADVDKVYDQAVSTEEEQQEAAKSDEQKAADAAKQKAVDAAKEAADAQEKADEAKKAAEEAKQAAENAGTDSSSADSSSDVSASDASSVASSAEKAADDQKKAAEQAAVEASDAQQKAEEAAEKAEQEAEEAEKAAKTQKEAAEKAEAAAETAQKAADKASSSSSKSSSTTTASSGGSAKGQAVANYALQFLGNPYVYGGSSLTNGTDCSGFVMSVYSHFGVSLPHYDAADRSQGTAVSSLAEAQPGDIVCYYGHVGIYIGNGQMVNASNPTNGIIITNASYRQIVAIRRIFS